MVAIDSGPFLMVLAVVFGIPLLIPIVIGIVRGTGGRFWRKMMACIGMGVLTVAAMTGWIALIANTGAFAVEDIRYLIAILAGWAGIIVASVLFTWWLLNQLKAA